MSDKNLSNKVAVVTGGADGIGEGIARTLRGRGAHVVIADVQEEKGALLAAELGENASFILLDVTDWGSWNNLVGELSSHPGHLDILVNNAGGAVSATLISSTLKSGVISWRLTWTPYFSAAKPPHHS